MTLTLKTLDIRINYFCNLFLKYPTEVKCTAPSKYSLLLSLTIFYPGYKNKLLSFIFLPVSCVVLPERGHDIIAMANEKNVLIGLTILCSFASGSIKNFHRLSRGWIFVDGFYLFKSWEERRTEGRRARSRFVRCILSRRLNPPVDDTLFIVNRADLISRRFTTRPMFTVCNYIWCRNDRDAGKKIID